MEDGVPLDDSLFMATPVALAPYVTITHGMRGHFAVLMFWDADGEFWDVWQSGIGSYATADEAACEAREWANAEGLEYRR